MHAACHTHLIIFDFIIVIIFGYVRKADNLAAICELIA
jgi:hypothetical protein